VISQTAKICSQTTDAQNARRRSTRTCASATPHLRMRLGLPVTTCRPSTRSPQNCRSADRPQFAPWKLLGTPRDPLKSRISNFPFPSPRAGACGVSNRQLPESTIRPGSSSRLPPVNPRGRASRAEGTLWHPPRIVSSRGCAASIAEVNRHGLPNRIASDIPLISNLTFYNRHICRGPKSLFRYMHRRIAGADHLSLSVNVAPNMFPAGPDGCDREDLWLWMQIELKKI
jgi:hypothetical protein